MAHEKSFETPFVTDLHAHTWYSAVNEWVQHSPEQLVETAAQQGLGGIALTGHDTLAGIEEALSAGNAHDVVVTPGVEITSAHVGNKHGLRLAHLIGLLPVDEALELETTEAKLPSLHSPRYIADWVHGHGGVVFAAHPKKGGDFISMSHGQLKKNAPWLDGVEIETRFKSQKSEKLVELAARHGLAAIGASDAHELDHVGVAATEILNLLNEFTSDDILTSIRKGHTVAVRRREATGDQMTEGASQSYLRRRSKAASQ